MVGDFASGVKARREAEGDFWRKKRREKSRLARREFEDSLEGLDGESVWPSTLRGES